jgi:hypothetical protein
MIPAQLDRCGMSKANPMLLRSARGGDAPRHPMRIGVAVLGLLLACASTLSPTASAAEGDGSTVISVGGGAWWKSRVGDSWRELTMDVRLNADTWLKTDAESFVRLALAPEGRLVQIAAGQEGTLAILLQKTPAAAAKSNVFTALTELFSGASQERKAVSYAPVKAARESASFSLGGAPPAAALAAAPPPLDESWLQMVRQPTVQRTDVEPMLKQASQFADRAVQNRAVALLTRLSQAFPEDAALRGLAGQVTVAWGAPGLVKLTRRTAAGAQDMPDAAPLAKGDHVRITYVADSESFPVIWDVSPGKSGALETNRLYPPKGKLVDATPARQAIALPRPDGWFHLEGDTRAEHVLAWVCAAPPPEPALSAAAEAAAKLIADGAPLDPARLPPVPYCPQVVALRYPVQ